MTSIGTTSKKVILNYNFQKVDTRDYKFLVNSDQLSAVSIPSNFSLKDKITKIYDQGNLGSCVSNAFAGYINMRTNHNLLISRLFHYYCGRMLQGGRAVNYDTGLSLRGAASVLKKYGTCKEIIWQYIISRFKIRPPISVFRSARFFKNYTYSFLPQDLTSLTSYLSNQQLPILFGFYVYSSFMTDVVRTTGVVPMPDKTKDRLLGGHCVFMIGFDDTTRKFTCVNSWGASWGNRGFFTIPYEYLLDPSLAADFCCLSFVY